MHPVQREDDVTGCAWGSLEERARKLNLVRDAGVVDSGNYDYDDVLKSVACRGW